MKKYKNSEDAYLNFAKLKKENEIIKNNTHIKEFEEMKLIHIRDIIHFGIIAFPITFLIPGSISISATFLIAGFSGYLFSKFWKNIDNRNYFLKIIKNDSEKRIANEEEMQNIIINYNREEEITLTVNEITDYDIANKMHEIINRIKKLDNYYKGQYLFALKNIQDAYFEQKITDKVEANKNVLSKLEDLECDVIIAESNVLGFYIQKISKNDDIKVRSLKKDDKN